MTSGEVEMLTSYYLDVNDRFEFRPFRRTPVFQGLSCAHFSPTNRLLSN